MLTSHPSPTPALSGHGPSIDPLQYPIETRNDSPIVYRRQRKKSIGTVGQGNRAMINEIHPLITHHLQSKDPAILVTIRCEVSLSSLIPFLGPVGASVSLCLRGGVGCVVPWCNNGIY